MKLKRIAIISGISLLCASPLIALAFINFFPKNQTSDSRFIIQDETTKKLKEELKKALDDTIGNNTLPLKFYTLTKTAQYTPSKLSWFSELDKALKWLDPRLDFELIPRSNQTVETGFRQKNGEMVSMFWSPDYHNIGTWLSFWFCDTYVVPDLWPNLYNELSDGDNQVWEDDLKSFLENEKLFAQEPQWFIDKGFTNNLFQSYDSLLEIDLVAKTNGQSTNFKSTNISNTIGEWADTADQENAISFVSWMNSQYQMIPWISDGPTTTKKLLVRENFHTPKNTYSEETFRDWYYDGNDAISKKFTIWLANDPFETNKTPYNPSFNDAANSQFFQSTFNGLTDWKINGDWEMNDDGTWKKPEAELTLGAPTKIIMKDSNGSEIKTFPSSGNATSSSSVDDFTIYKAGQEEDVRNKAKSALKYEFIIDPQRFNWYSIDGNTNVPLTAADFFFGFLGYILSCDINVNTNSYFIDLMGLDVDETIKANTQFFDLIDTNLPENQKYSSWNIKIKNNLQSSNDLSNSINKFTMVLKRPNVNFLDIIAKQYFQPLPIKNTLVQNIFQGKESSKGLYYTVNSQGKASYDVKKSDFNNLYGSGNRFENYQNWWSAGSYYVTKATEQDITFKLNDNYFNQFPSDMFTNKNQKIGTVVMKYGGAFSDQLTYTQFQNNEIDRSNIPISRIDQAARTMKSSFRTEGVSNVSKTDIVSFNINVLERDDNNIGYKSADGVDSSRVVEDINENKRVLKSLVSKEYYNAIVKDFSVENGNSMKIRKAIINSIDWYSLAALAIPEDNPNFQISVIPYGNMPINKNGFTTYYELASNELNYALMRRDIWVILNYKNNWLKQFD